MTDLFCTLFSLFWGALFFFVFALLSIVKCSMPTRYTVDFITSLVFPVAHYVVCFFITGGNVKGFVWSMLAIGVLLAIFFCPKALLNKIKEQKKYLKNETKKLSKSNKYQKNKIN